MLGDAIFLLLTGLASVLVFALMAARRRRATRASAGPLQWVTGCSPERCKELLERVDGTELFHYRFTPAPDGTGGRLALTGYEPRNAGFFCAPAGHSVYEVRWERRDGRTCLVLTYVPWRAGAQPCVSAAALSRFLARKVAAEPLAAA